MTRMSDEYTPTTQSEITPDVEALHMIIGLGNFEATGSTGGNTYDLAQRIMSSDWLEAHDREVAEASAKQALEDAADDWHAEHEGTRPVPYIWLVRRAASFSADPEGATK